jgi:hypothetical protein
MKKLKYSQSFEAFYNDLTSKIEMQSLLYDRERVIKKRSLYESNLSKLKVLSKILLIVFRSFKYIFASIDNSTDEICLFFDLTRQHLVPTHMNEKDLELFFEKDFVERLNFGYKKIVIVGNESYNNLYTKLHFVESYTKYLFTGKITLAQIKRILYFLPIIVIKLFNNNDFRMIANDLLEISLSLNLLTNNSNSSFIITNSSLEQLPSVFYIKKQFRAFETVCLLYSENNFLITNSQKISFAPESDLVLKNFFIDRLFTWTNEYKSFLEKYSSNTQIYCRGSIIFKHKPNVLGSNLKKTVTVFDIIPDINESIASLNHVKFSLEFLDEILELKKLMIKFEKDCEIIIKHSRRVIPSHHLEYIKKLQSLKNDYILKEVPYNSSIYELVQQSKLVICAIGTSPALVAREYGIPVAYLCTSLNVFSGPVDYNIQTVKSGADLYNLYIK